MLFLEVTVNISLTLDPCAHDPYRAAGPSRWDTGPILFSGQAGW